MDAKDLVENLLGDESPEDVKAFLDRHFRPIEKPDKKHLFISSTDGHLYDTRKPNWHKEPPLRTGYQFPHRTIQNINQFKAAWRARYMTNYPLAFIMDDGGAVCEACVEKNLRRIMSSVRGQDNDGWRAVGVAACHGSDADQEDYHTQCANCNKNLGELG